MKTLEELSNLHNKTFSLFIYKHDDKNYGVMEDWRSHSDAVNENKQFIDDCDGFAFTMCELMLEQGYDRDKVMFIICKTETGEGHAVAGYQLDGTTYITENRFREVYDWKDRPEYDWNFYMNFSEPGQWYEVTN